MEFPQWVVDRVMARQGCLHPYDVLPAERLAVVVVDLQNYYMSPGYQGETPPARATVITSRQAEGASWRPGQ